MDPREELIALRRLAELEAKAGGTQPAAAPAERSWLSRTFMRDPTTPAPPTMFSDPSAQVTPEATRAQAQPMIDAAAGGLRGAGSIGATGMRILPNALGGDTAQENAARRADMDASLRDFGADTNSLYFGASKLGMEIAGTAGAGGAIANTAARVPGVAAAAPNLLNAVRTSGMSAGASTGVPNALFRATGGAVTGGASAGLVDPEQAGTGVVTGGTLPGALKAVGTVGSAIGKGARATVGQASPEVAALADRAKQLGIDIPADRLLNSRPLDAVASGLNYVPFSGRAATERRMVEQLDTAASRLMGQNTPNINKSVRAASVDLGAKFDTTLKSTGVRLDQQLKQDMATVYNTAEKELGSDLLKPITAQVAEVLEKGASGVIDGQAAYNIKRTLDRLSRGNTPTAYHALELKGVLMDALNRSLGPTEAAAFATTRQQYGNMLALEKIASNGAESGLSVAKLANMKNINNAPLQELADIAAQFVKAREGAHGSMQRAVVGLGAGTVGGLLGVAGVVASGRATNSLLNSGMARSMALGQSPQPNRLQQILADQDLQQLGYRAAPVAVGGP